MGRKFKVMFVQFPGGGTTRIETALWVAHTYAQMKEDARIDQCHLRVYSDVPITMTRNRAIKDALAGGYDYALWVDNDMVPDLHGPGAQPFWPTAWEFLMRRRAREEAAAEPLPAATIAAPYCGPPPLENVFVFEWEDFETGDPDRRYRLVQYTRNEAFRRAGIEEVAALPTGLILYDLRLFGALPMPWFAYEWADAEQAEKASTEDVYQTRNASLLGFPQYCNWDSWAGHVKMKRVVKPHPIAVEDVAGGMQQALLAGVSRARRLEFRGDPEERDRPFVKRVVPGWCLAPAGPGACAAGDGMPVPGGP